VLEVIRSLASCCELVAFIKCCLCKLLIAKGPSQTGRPRMYRTPFLHESRKEYCLCGKRSRSLLHLTQAEFGGNMLKSRNIMNTAASKIWILGFAYFNQCKRHGAATESWKPVERVEKLNSTEEGKGRKSLFFNLF